MANNNLSEKGKAASPSWMVAVLKQSQDQRQWGEEKWEWQTAASANRNSRIPTWWETVPSVRRLPWISMHDVNSSFKLLFISGLLAIQTVEYTSIPSAFTAI